MRIVCGEQMGTARLSDVAPSRILVMSCSFSSGNPAIRSRSCFLPPVPPLRSVPLLTRLADAVICLVISPRSSYRRAGRLCLLAAVGSFGSVSFPSSARSFLTHRHLLGRERFSFPAVSSCLLRFVRSGYCSTCGVVAVPVPRASACGTSLLASCPSCSLIAFVPFLVPSCCPICFSSPFAPFCDTTGGEMSCGVRLRLARCSFSLLAVLGGGADCFRVRMAWYHFGSFSPWWCSMWIVWLGGLLAIPMVYWYCQLVVYIVRLDF